MSTHAEKRPLVQKVLQKGRKRSSIYQITATLEECIMHSGKRYLSILLTICMLATILPLDVAAQTPGQG